MRAIQSGNGRRPLWGRSCIPFPRTDPAGGAGDAASGGIPIPRSPPFPFSPCFQCMPSLVPSQPKIRGAGRCASEAVGRRIGMLRQPKLPGGASRCATGVLRMRVVMLREFRVSDRLLSFRLGGAFCHFDRTLPLSFRPGSVPLSLRPGSAPCHFDRAVASGEICGALRQTGAREGPFCALG